MSDKPVARFAGIWTTAELIAGGCSASRIRLLVRRGVLVPVGYGAYARAAVARMADSSGGALRLRMAAVLAVAGPGDVGSHHSAAAIHGLDVLGQQPSDLAVTRPPGGSQKARAGVHVHVAALPGEHVTVHGGVRVTSVARTVVDLARTSPFRDGVVVADSALRNGQTTKDELLSVVADCAKWPGIRRARMVVDFCDGKSESVLESISRVAFRDHGLPAPELQVWVGGEETGVVGRADFLWRRYQRNGEAGGAGKSCTSPGTRSTRFRIRWRRRSGKRSVEAGARSNLARNGATVREGV